MKEIQYEIVKEIAVLSTGDSGYTKEINLISVSYTHLDVYKRQVISAGKAASRKGDLPF